MEFDLFAAAVAGLLAGLVMLAARLTIRAVGVDLRMDVTRMWSAMFRAGDAIARPVGLAFHMVVSVLVGILYGFGVRALGAGDGLWLWGLAGGIVHYAIAGLFIAAAPQMTWGAREPVPSPGPFANRLGVADVIGFLVGHLVYGIAFGIAYAVLHRQGGWPLAV